MKVKAALAKIHKCQPVFIFIFAPFHVRLFPHAYDPVLDFFP